MFYKYIKDWFVRAHKMSENTVKGGKNSTMLYAVVEDVTCEPIHSKYQTDTPSKQIFKNTSYPCSSFCYQARLGLQ